MEKRSDIQLPGWERDEAELVRSYKVRPKAGEAFGRVAAPELISDGTCSEMVKPVSERIRKRRDTLSFLTSLFR